MVQNATSSAKIEMINSAISRVTQMDHIRACQDGKGITAKKPFALKDATSSTDSAQDQANAHVDMAGKVAIALSVKSIRVAIKGHVINHGSASARKDGEV